MQLNKDRSYYGSDQTRSTLPVSRAQTNSEHWSRNQTRPLPVKFFFYYCNLHSSSTTLPPQVTSDITTNWQMNITAVFYSHSEGAEKHKLSIINLIKELKY